jgi:hypothetical protein
MSCGRDRTTHLSSVKVALGIMLALLLTLVATGGASAYESHGCSYEYGCIWNAASFGGTKYSYKDSNESLGSGALENVSITNNGNTSNKYNLCWYDVLHSQWYQNNWETGTGNAGSYWNYHFTRDRWEAGGCP